MVQGARQSVTALFWVGALLAVVGSVFAVLAWPGMTEHGSLWLSLGMGVVASAGWAMAWVALVAWGVRLGVESAARSS